MARTKNLADVIRKKLAENPDLAAAVEREYLNANIGSQIYEARKAHGLTQEQLADRIGTHQPVIARLEDAEYEGHSLSMLVKIASALGQRVRVVFESDLTSAPASDPAEAPPPSRRRSRGSAAQEPPPQILAPPKRRRAPS